MSCECGKWNRLKWYLCWRLILTCVDLNAVPCLASVLFIFLYSFSMLYMFLETYLLIFILHYLNLCRILESCKMNQVALESD